MPMTNAAEYLERTAARVPDKVAFSDASGSLTFGQLLQDARALGTVLAGLPGCKNAPARFFPAARSIAVLPPTEESTAARSGVGIWINGIPRRYSDAASPAMSPVTPPSARWTSAAPCTGSDRSDS